MNFDRINSTSSILVLAVSAAVYGQEPKAGTQSTATTAVSGTVQNKENTVSQPAFRFEGTDLRIGNAPPITFHGFASQGLLTSTDYNYLGKTANGLGSAEFNEFALNASVSPFNRTRIAAQAFTFDLGNVGNYDPMLDYALVEYTVSDAFGMRGGRVRRPSGIYNHIQDIDLARTWVLLPQGMYDARWRDFSASVDGGSVFGNISLSKAGSLSYEGYAGMINLSQEGGIARWIQNGLPPSPIGTFGSVEDSLLSGAQLWWNTPIPGLRAGASMGQSFGLAYNYTVAPPIGPGLMQTEIDTPFQQYSVEYVWKSWTFQAEYQTMNNIQRDMVAGNVVSRSRERHDAWYVGAAYRFNKWLEAGTYYTESYNDVADRDGSTRKAPSDAYQKDLALSLRFDPKPWWILKLEGHYINGTGLLRANNMNPARDDDGWFMIGLKTTFSF